MRFFDYNGSGKLEPQDLTTSVVVDETGREKRSDYVHSPNPLESNAGCATMAAFIAIPILLILLAFSGNHLNGGVGVPKGNAHVA